MTSREKFLLMVGLVIVCLICTWLLYHTAKHQLRLRALRAQRARVSLPPDPYPPEEIWRWPERGKYAPGEWGGPTEVLQRFLDRRGSLIRVELKLRGLKKVQDQLTRVDQAIQQRKNK